MKSYTYQVELKELLLESGYLLTKAKAAVWDTGGQNKPIVWFCHALTANADATQWWPGLVGPGKLFCTKQFRLIGVNNLGSCYGSCGPFDAENESNSLFANFPEFSIRDMQQFLELVANVLNITTIHCIVGGSMGGQIALEWLFKQPDRFKSYFLIASNLSHSAWGIAFNEAQRMAILADNSFYTNTPDAGKKGLEAARAMAMLSYRTYRAFANIKIIAESNLYTFPAISYLKHQSEKLSKRFQAHSYFLLTKAMDSHNIYRNRNPNEVNQKLKSIHQPGLIIGIKTDWLFPFFEQKNLAKSLGSAKFSLIRSTHGHDGFLTETKLISKIAQPFIQNI